MNVWGGVELGCFQPVAADVGSVHCGGRAEKIHAKDGNSCRDETFKSSYAFWATSIGSALLLKATNTL